MQLHELTITQAAKKLADGETSSKDLTRAMLDRLEATEPQISAYLAVTPEKALAQAEAADKMRLEGECGPLCGIPCGIKDVISTEGVTTTCGSKILENYVPPFDAHLVQSLKDQGMVMLGKHNMDEFAMGSSTENSAYGSTKNPWDYSRTPGGSSGGSAASVAARSSFYSIGTDTGGSIRQPAAYCGVVGLKPTYGRVSRYGLVAYGSSLDQAGPVTRTVEDAALVLQAIAGYDRRDSTCAPMDVPDYSAALNRDIKGLKLGVPKEYFVDGMDPEVESGVRAALAKYEAMGAELVEISLPHTDYALSAYYVIATAEASSNLARFDGVRYGLSVRDKDAGLRDMYQKTRTEGFGPEVIRRIMLGTFALSAGYYDAYYGKAGKVRTLLCRDFAAAFEQVDAIVCPVAPGPAFKLGEHSDDPVKMYLEDVFTLSCNMAGLPGLSLPCGFSEAGLPIGMQIMGPHFAEETLLALGHAYQQEDDSHLKAPAI